MTTGKKGGIDQQLIGFFILMESWRGKCIRHFPILRASSTLNLIHKL